MGSRFCTEQSKVISEVRLTKLALNITPKIIRTMAKHHAPNHSGFQINFCSSSRSFTISKAHSVSRDFVHSAWTVVISLRPRCSSPPILFRSLPRSSVSTGSRPVLTNTLHHMLSQELLLFKALSNELFIWCMVADVFPWWRHFADFAGGNQLCGRKGNTNGFVINAGYLAAWSVSATT